MYQALLSCGMHPIKFMFPTDFREYLKIINNHNKLSKMKRYNFKNCKFGHEYTINFYRNINNDDDNENICDSIEIAINITTDEKLFYEQKDYKLRN